MTNKVTNETMILDFFLAWPAADILYMIYPESYSGFNQEQVMNLKQLIFASIELMQEKLKESIKEDEKVKENWKLELREMLRK